MGAGPGLDEGGAGAGLDEGGAGAGPGDGVPFEALVKPSCEGFEKHFSQSIDLAVKHMFL